MMIWPEECQLVFSDEGELIPPRKKHRRKKDGSFPRDKSKGKLKSITCFADELADYPSYNDLLEDPSAKNPLTNI